MDKPKYKRVKIGSIHKEQTHDKEGNELQYPIPKQLVINDYGAKPLMEALKNVTETNKLYLRLETKQMQLESLQAAVTNGKLSEKDGKEAMDRVKKTPDFVVADVVLRTKI